MKFRYTIIALFLVIPLFSQGEALPTGWKKMKINGKTVYKNLVTEKYSTVKPTKAVIAPINNDDEFDPTIIHVVGKGESLSSIAKAYNTNLTMLYKLNNMDNFDLLSIGQEIKVGYAHNEEEKQAVLRGYKQLTHNTKDNNSKVKATLNYKYHVVAEDETLYSLAKNYNTTIAIVKELNNLTDNTIFVGQKLRVK